MRIGFGCVNLGSASRGHSWQADVRLVREAVDRGITLFDTADVYGSGASERVLGRALGSRRSAVTVATKGGYLFRPRTPAEQTARRLAVMARRAAGRGNSVAPRRPPRPVAATSSRTSPPAYLRTAVEASLRRLRTDHIDVFQLHGPHTVVPDLFEQLQDLVTAGKVGRFGVGAESVPEAADVAAGQPASRWPSSRSGSSIRRRPTTRSRSPNGEESRCGCVGVLGGGLLAAAAGDSTPIQHHPKRPLIQRLQELAARHDIGLDRLAIGFAASFPRVSTMLVGISTTSHLHRNLDLVAAGPLDPEVLAEVARPSCTIRRRRWMTTASSSSAVDRAGRWPPRRSSGAASRPPARRRACGRRRG